MPVYADAVNGTIPLQPNDMSADPHSPDSPLKSVPGDAPDQSLQEVADLDPAGIHQMLPRLVAASQTNPAKQSTTNRAVGDKLVLLGVAPRSLQGSRYLELVRGRLAASSLPANGDRRLGDTISTLLGAAAVSESHSLAGAGLLTSVSEMLLSSAKPVGAKLDLSAFGVTRFDVLLFGQSANCAVVVLPHQRVGTVLSEAHTSGVDATLIGEFVAAEELVVQARGIIARWSLAELRAPGAKKGAVPA